MGASWGGGGRKPAGRSSAAEGEGRPGRIEARQGGGVLRVEEFFGGDGGEVGVAEVIGAVLVGAAEGFGDDVDLRGGAIGVRARPGPRCWRL